MCLLSGLEKKRMRLQWAVGFYRVFGQNVEAFLALVESDRKLNVSPSWPSWDYFHMRWVIDQTRVSIGTRWLAGSAPTLTLVFRNVLACSFQPVPSPWIWGACLRDSSWLGGNSRPAVFGTPPRIQAAAAHLNSIDRRGTCWQTYNEFQSEGIECEPS